MVVMSVDLQFELVGGWERARGFVPAALFLYYFNILMQGLFSV